MTCGLPRPFLSRIARLRGDEEHNGCAQWTGGGDVALYSPMTIRVLAWGSPHLVGLVLQLEQLSAGFPQQRLGRRARHLFQMGTMETSEARATCRQYQHNDWPA